MPAFWASLGSGRFVDTGGATRSVAEDVLRTFGLEYTGTGGGPLSGIDIKHLDALTAIRLSLLEDLAYSGRHKELVVDGDGTVKIKDVGSGSGVSDIYYSMQSYDYITRRAGVMVTGAKPLPSRRMGQWLNVLQGAIGFDATNMVSNCLRDNFSQYYVIVYDDPHLNSTYADGIDNLYEVTSPFESIIGYAHHIDPGPVNDDVTITFGKQASVPIELGNQVGELATPPSTSDIADCYVNLGEAAEGGIPVNLPSALRFTSNRGITYDKFIKVSAVFMIGIDLAMCYGVPKNYTEALRGESTPENTDLWVSIENPVMSVVRLNAGVHYVVNYDTGVPMIKFADRSNPMINPKFGDKAKAYVTNTCLFGKTNPTIEGTIFPTDAYRGVWVYQIYAVVDLDTPCITIFDPKGHAGDIAQNIVYEMSPILLTSEPAPVAVNGNLLDMSDQYADHDPTTVQDFTHTEYEQALDYLDGGAGLSLSLSSLDSMATARLSDELWRLFSNDRGVSTTYICGPDCNPEVGARGPGGGIINEVTYAYSDSGSYTVSVTEGPELVGGFPSITSGVHVKMTEEVSAGGIVIQDEGNNCMFKVLVDGIGVRTAINMCPSVIRVGDRVTVSIHNNPVEG